MGLSSFNRMRRQRNEVELLEAKRFEENNKARWNAHHTLDKMQGTVDEKAVEKIRAAETKASEAIGELNRKGLDSEIPDVYMRKEHAAEMAGRNIEGTYDPQMDTMTDSEKRTVRVPESAPASELLVEKTSVEQPGPTVAEVTAAQVEQGIISPDVAKEQVAEAKADEKEAKAQAKEDEKEVAKAAEADTAAAEAAADAKNAKTAAASDAKGDAALPAAGPDKSGKTSSAAAAKK